jgi:hypothetical protein
MSIYREGLVRPGGVVGGLGQAHGEPTGRPLGEGSVGELRLGEGVGGGQHEGAHLGQGRAGDGAVFWWIRGAGAIRAPRAELAGRGSAPGVQTRPWDR